MARLNRHVYPIGIGWSVTNERKNDLYLLTYDKEEAIAFAIEEAKRLRVDAVIHKKNGTIKEVIRFRKVPQPVKA